MSAKPEQSRSGPGGYVSEFDQFIHDYMAQHPEVEQSQAEGWYIWWDHMVDLNDLETRHDNDVPVKPYHYD
ncbi:hypothetical protein CR105_06720 [Massilia eurypsychrophila]|jgi:hypothetical protein|uniref:DUF3460 domain-containing protein n=1 Tax=Massilia eurypsychrophila TaxID=1485217 RepID=A0A2G8TI87_9BURK|nr:DUF3460 family protein [Massilia eurypsychrophila]PIL45752.1 hypothetical protein CR105_06720 [Massilia eurypsychrophila]